MYSAAPSSYEKFTGGAPTSPIFTPNSTTTGIPVSSTSQFYSSQNSASSSHLESKNKDPWSTGLCDCFSDCRNCCITCWCPCVTFGQIAEIVDKGSSSCGVNGALYTLIACVTGCACCYSCFYRAKMRQQYTLKESPCGDCLVHCFCEYCALCQEYRELKNHGYDLSIGWHGNVEKKNRSLEMASVAPTVEGAYGVNVALYTLMLCVTGNACWYSCFYRGEIRELYALKESPCEDCLVHCFCEYCALCQEYRELKIRGYDLSIGWHGNAEKKNRSLEMASEAPPIEGAMSR